MKVVDLADEFGLTTSEAIDACLWAGVPANSSATELSEDDAARVRELIAGWIDAGFVPWRSEGEQRGRKAKGSVGPTKGTVSTGKHQDPSVGTKATTADASNGDGKSAASTSAPEDGEDGSPPAEPRTSERIPLASAPGPLLPPTRGGPTGWLPGGPDAHARVSPLAIVALALAITSLVIPFLTAILAIVLASVAKERIEKSRGWRTGERLATTAQVVAGVGVGLWIVLAIGQLLILQNRNDEVLPADIQVDVRDVEYSEIKAGDCVRVPKQGDITEWRTVRCDEPHQAEVIGDLPVSNPLNASYPGDGPIRSVARVDCRSKLSRYMQDPPEEAAMEVGYAYPSSNSWRNERDRTIWCIAFRQDGTLLSASLKPPTTTNTGG